MSKLGVFDLSVRYGKLTAVNTVSFTVSEGERLYRVRFEQIAVYVRTGEVGTHVRNKTAKFSYIGVFFHRRVWYTRLSSTNKKLTKELS